MYTGWFFITILVKFVYASLDSDIALQLNSSKTLSRRRRYVVFPEGSSFQLVYCLTMPTYGMGQIFTMGLTAALAWELPHEPIYLKGDKKTGAADKRVDKPTNVDTGGPVYKAPVTEFRQPWSEAGWITYSEPHTAQFIINKSRYQPGHNEKQLPVYKTAGAKYWDHLPAYKNEYLYRKHGEVHRRTRRSLFQKIEKFFMAQNKDGKACLLKALCEVNQQRDHTKGTFIEEILRAIFTWHPDDMDDSFIDYNLAATHKNNCTETYPTCSQSVWNSFM